MCKLLVFKVQEFKAKFEQQKGSAGTASNEKAPKEEAWATLATRPPTLGAFSPP